MEKVKVRHGPKTTYNVMLYPSNAISSSAMTTVVHSLTAQHKDKTKVTAVKMMSWQDEDAWAVKPLSRKQLKYDNLLGPGYSRAALLGMNLNLESFVTLSLADDLVQTAAEQQTDLLMIGCSFNDDESFIKECMTKSSTNIAIFCGPDPGLGINKILIPYTDSAYLMGSLTMDFIRRFLTNQTCEIVLLKVASPVNRPSTGTEEELHAYTRALEPFMLPSSKLKHKTNETMQPILAMLKEVVEGQHRLLLLEGINEPSGEHMTQTLTALRIVTDESKTCSTLCLVRGINQEVSDRINNNTIPLKQSSTHVTLTEENESSSSATTAAVVITTANS